MKIRLFTIPNMLTLSNLLCGSIAVVATLRDSNIQLAFYLIIAAAVFDFFDGFTARLLHSSSAIGGELDSLADMISFGLAPSAILFTIFNTSSSEFGLWSGDCAQYIGYMVFILAAFSALRLAKFNIDTTQSDEFCGMPTPAATLFCASIGLLCEMGKLIIYQEAIIAIAVIMALLLISPIRMFALKFHGFGWQGNQLRYIFILVSAVLIFTLKLFSIPAIIIIYTSISLVRWLVNGAKR